jgi:phosphotransferase system HPr (HPr) family protein
VKKTNAGKENSTIMRNEDKTQIRELVISNSLGLHLRPVSLIVQTALKYNVSATLESDDGKIKADAKSVTSLLSLVCPAGTKVRLAVSGPDALKAADAIAELVKRGFDED